jgi:5'-3' exonuclease
MGDNSDNVPGVKGLGPKKLFKLFPELEKPEKITFSEIMKKCNEKRLEHGLYEDICNFNKQLQLNQQLMDLTEVDIPEYDIVEIEKVLTNEPTKLDKLSFLKLYNEDRLQNSIPNVEIWLTEIFSYLHAYKLK